MPKKVSVLATGLSGLIGGRFARLYADRFSFSNLDLTTGVDITKAKEVEEAVKQSPASSILHLAAYTNVRAAFEQTGDKTGLCYQVNVVGTQNIVTAANKHGKHVIHISTDFVFDGTKQEPYTEADEPNPIEWYSQTKFEAEQLVQNGLDSFTILRLAYPYQANPNRPDFLANIQSDLIHNRLPPAFADHYVTPTFADDLAKVFAFCIENQPTGLYHAVGSSWHTDFEIAQKVKSAFNLTGTIQKGSLATYLKTVQRPYQQNLKLSNAKLQKDFGISMKTFDEGLEEMKKQVTSES